MIDLLNKIKSAVLFALVFLLIGAGSWELIRRHIYKVPSHEIIVTKTETKFIHDPSSADYQTLLDWSKSPILIDYKFLSATSENTTVNVFAHDLNKSTEQSIKVPVAQTGNFRMYFEIGAGVAILAGGVYLGSKYLK